MRQRQRGQSPEAILSFPKYPPKSSGNKTEAGQTLLGVLRGHPGGAGCLRRGNERRVDRLEVTLDGLAEGCNGANAQDGDQADEHAVFDEGRALLVLDK